MMHFNRHFAALCALTIVMPVPAAAIAPPPTPELTIAPVNQPGATVCNAGENGLVCKEISNRYGLEVSDPLQVDVDGVTGRELEFGYELPKTVDPKRESAVQPRRFGPPSTCSAPVSASRRAAATTDTFSSNRSGSLSSAGATYAAHGHTAAGASSLCTGGDCSNGMSQSEAVNVKFGDVGVSEADASSQAGGSAANSDAVGVTGVPVVGNVDATAAKSTLH
ncbi:hypothetical protein K488DRAFT_72602 [Vararia minispora EC-137]|uniref:Uncharacterized protein n=1 Tax=Vararia minispora EC-137 TaxID=1314806 RepID=A0ACB8QE52_9AGAM|nr:hypothetical protein K488DRAFT_72602 [Vararia minispora EC-137]